MAVRTASLSDEEQIRELHLAAFGAEERDLVASFAVDLLRETATPKILHLVAEKDGCLVGHIAFSPVRARSDGNVIAYILAPLAVAPSFQKTGVGSRLVREGLDWLSAQNIRVVLVYGDPDFYGRFGFGVELAESFVPPFKLKYPSGWQALSLTEQKAHVSSESFECVDSLSKAELW